MEDLFQNTLAYLLLYKYVALFLITFFAAFALPLPSTTSLVTAAGFASQGYMSIEQVILWAILGNVLADNLLYWVTRYFGTSLLKIRLAESSLFHFIVAHLHRHSNLVIFWSRFQVVPTLTVNVLSGLARSDFRKFFWFGLFGETVQVLIFAGVGYFFGSQFTDTNTISPVWHIAIASAIGILIILLLFRRGLVAYVNKHYQPLY